MKFNKLNIQEYLRQSNYIEDEFSIEAFEDSLKAWDYIHSIVPEKVELRDILEIHKILLQRISPEIAGKFRMVNVRVGTRICPDWTQVSVMLADWWQQHRNAYTTEEIKAAHVAFEMVHPFEDGNGRVGRIIMLWQICKSGQPLFIINADDRSEYYKWFHDGKMEAS